MRKQVSRPVIFSADGAYAFPTLVSMTSLFLNSPHLDFDTYWITSDRPTGANNPAVTAAIDKLSDTFARRITIVPIDDSCFDSFSGPPQLPYLGTVTYNWLLIPSVLQCDSFVLLDSDIIVQDDLEYLFSLNLTDNIVAGVSNGTEVREKENERLGLPAENAYLNTGVMVVDARRWRQENILEILKAWYKDHSDLMRLADQDMMNVVLQKRKVVLDRKWNTQLHTLSDDDIEKFDADAFKGIFHFTGPDKPWRPEARAGVKALFDKYARVTRPLIESNCLPIAQNDAGAQIDNTPDFAAAISPLTSSAKKHQRTSTRSGFTMLYRWKVQLLKRHSINLLWQHYRRLRGDLIGNYAHMADYIREYAKGCSFADIGCMWGVNGEFSFIAEESGAMPVKAVDVFGPTPEFEAKKRERNSSVEFILGDATHADTIAHVGEVDIVFCAGVLYHHPSPFDLLVALRRICRRKLILRTYAIPEINGLPNAAVYFPLLEPKDRRLWDLTGLGVSKMIGITDEFKPEVGYANFLWGLTPSCLVSLLSTAGFHVDLRANEAFAQTVICTPTEIPFAHVLPSETAARELGETISRAGVARPC